MITDRDKAMMNTLRPLHPGEQLRDELEALGMSARALAKALPVPVNRITSILNEQRAITADTALRLARYLGGIPEFWLNWLYLTIRFTTGFPLALPPALP